MEDFDFSWLEKEWVVGRAGQINEQLQKRYLHLSQNRTPERLQEIVETQEVPDSLRGDVTAQTLAALVQVQIENALASIAIWLAENEPAPG